MIGPSRIMMSLPRLAQDQDVTGFYPQIRAMDRHIMAECGASRPKICLIPTASGDAEAATLDFYRRYSALGCNASDLSVMRYKYQDVASLIAQQDAIYIGD